MSPVAVVVGMRGRDGSLNRGDATTGFCAVLAALLAFGAKAIVPEAPSTSAVAIASSRTMVE